MDYLVIARKYRPQTFDDVAGQEVVARTLTNAIRSHRVAHAYLFTGPRGVGKTSMARILAKALTCVEGPTTRPCGVCDHCKMIADSNHPDVLEIDAARFGKVDDIRELSDSLSFAPSQARLRIIILDEVHMLSTAAWNALLKVLEEPPAHVRYIFATTEVDKVLPTVLSRCQRFDFRAIPLDVVVKTLAEIATKEGVRLPETVLTRIARAAGGGMRDAQTLMDQLIAVSDSTADGAAGVSEDDLTLLLGAARGGDVGELLDHLVGGRPAAALEVLERITGSGVAPTTLIEQLIDHVRAVLLYQACGAESVGLKRLGLPLQVIEPLAKAAAPEKTLRICQLLIGAQNALRTGVDPRLQLELTSIRIANLGNLVDVEALLRRVQHLEQARP